MKLEQQVVSLELAQKLKELGMKQESYFFWREGYHTHEWRDGEEWKKEGIFEGNFEVKAYPKPRMTTADVKWNEKDLARLDETEVSAFTVAELGEMLPWYINDYMWLEITRGSSTQNIWNVSYRKVRGGRNHNVIGDIDADTEADARAKMLVYLLENKLITL